MQQQKYFALKMSSMIGQIISHYNILEKLGEGGMGIVYKAHDSRLGRDVAIKFLSSELSVSAAEQERFRLEARAASSVNHPSICTIHDIGTHDGHLYFVMELVEGTTLLDIAGTMDEIPCLRIIKQAAEGLGAAHAKHIIHRDIKSSNIMRTVDGRVKIMDFGLAKISGRSDLTTVGSTVGTMAYLSPEQARGEQVDQRADIYSLGVVLFELLTGARPFSAPYNTAMLYQILNEEAPAPSSRKPVISHAVDVIVRRCIAKNAEDRYQTISELCSDIDAVLAGGNVAASRKAALGTKHRSFAHRRWLVPVLSLLVIGLLAVVVMTGDLWIHISHTLGISSVPEQLHLAVLPIMNIGNDADRQTLCDGLTETMTSQLTQLEQFQGSLWVVPSTEVRRAGIKSAEDARKSFGVNLVIDGSMQSIGNEYRLTLNLIDPKSVRQISSASIDISRDKLPLLQNESVMKVLEMLHVEMHPEIKNVLQSGGTSLPAAFEYYLKGCGQILRYENEENIDNAVLSFRQALQEDSLYALAHAALGEAFWRKYEAGKDTRWVQMAIAECRRAQKIDSTLAPVSNTLGIIFTGTGKPAKAIPLFEAALQNDPSNAEAYRGLAKAYEALGILASAERTYHRSIELRPDYWGGYNDLGVFYYKNNRYDDAITAFKKVIALTPDNYRGYNNLGGMYYFLQRWSDAREMFEHSFAIRPTYRTASNLGTLNYVEGKFSNAARWFERARTYDVKDHIITGNLASAYYWTKDEREKSFDLFRQAIGLAQEQLSVNPNDADILSSLGGYYAMVGDKDSSRLYTDRSLRLNKNDAGILFHAGTTYERIGNRSRALELIGKALEAGYSMSEISNQPELRDLYTDPGYKAIVARMQQHQ
jgi:serine/threonine protein kinase/tetratricopeptide (TPR) repeat protein